MEATNERNAQRRARNAEILMRYTLRVMRFAYYAQCFRCDEANAEFRGTYAD